MINRKYTGAPPKTQMPPGAIDTQTHIYLPGFPATPGAMGLPEGLPGPEDYRQVMGWIGVDRLVITQGNAHQRDNANLVAALGAMGEIARGVAVIDGQTPEAEVEHLHKAGVRGARIMDLPGGAVGMGALAEVDARARNAGWVMAVQFDGSDIADHMPQLSALKSNWILDHHGKFFRGAAPDGPEVAFVKRLIDNGNCWFKFAACYESSRSGGPDYADIGAVARIIASYAPERILWGTNFPHNQAKTTQDYPDEAALLDTVSSWFPDDRAQVLALKENAEGLFDFPVWPHSAG